MKLSSLKRTPDCSADDSNVCKLHMTSPVIRSSTASSPGYHVPPKIIHFLIHNYSHCSSTAFVSFGMPETFPDAVDYSSYCAQQVTILHIDNKQPIDLNKVHKRMLSIFFHFTSIWVPLNTWRGRSNMLVRKREDVRYTYVYPPQ